MKFNPEKHHRRSLRIKDCDYSKDGYYFVTICARNRENIFAEFCVTDFCVGVGLAPTPDPAPAISKGQPRGLPLHRKIAPALVLTTAGRIVKDNWRKIAQKNVKPDAFVIMPNHLHGIIIIKPHALGVGAGLAPAPDSSPDLDKGQPQGLPLHKKSAPAPDSSPDLDKGQPQGLPLQQKTIPALGDIIGAFKSRCAMDYLRYIEKNNLNESAKIWQRNYYEHIIRDRKELAAIRNYIKANPSNWHEDEENPLNLKK